MIDIHCHILPGIDDGAKTSGDTLAMLKSAIDEGITTITATPHHNPQFNNESPLILKKVKEVQNIIDEHQLPIEVLPGQEVRIYGDLLKDFSEGKLLTAAETSNYMLIEFPSNHVPAYAKELFYNCQLQGIQPILVHPERNNGIIENPDILFDFIEQGVLSQITASSITGHFGKKIQKLSFKMIENHLTHFVASDAHNVTSRAFKMKEAFEMMEESYGFGVSQMFQNNAECVILNESFYQEKPTRIKTKKFLGLF